MPPPDRPRSGDAPNEPDDLTPAQRRRLMQMIEARLQAAHLGDMAQFRREISALNRRTSEVVSGDAATNASRRNAFERIRDAFGAVNEEFALSGMLVAFVGATVLGVFGPFALAFAIVALIR